MPLLDRFRHNAARRDRDDPLARTDPDMRQVLAAWLAMEPRPIEALTPAEARQQPTPADGAYRILRQRRLDRNADLKVLTDEITIPGPVEGLPARIYRRAEGDRRRPVVLYIQGGGWVVADTNVYDASARAICRLVDAIVVSVHYRRAPENKFPAAHDDCYAAYRWLLDNASWLGGDPRRVAVMGESAGGNLAAHVAIRARDEEVQAPAHLALICPVAGGDLDTPSYRVHADAKPLNRAMMSWSFAHYLNGPQDLKDPRIDLVNADLRGLPSTTMVSAEIDPLRSEGQALADRLEAQGVEVRHGTYNGVTHEFFGMGLLVRGAAAAETFVAQELKQAFGTGG